jgi:hypothetical protein
VKELRVCLVVLVMILFYSAECSAKGSGINPYLGIGLDMRISRSIYRVSNIPLSIRDISIHPDGLIEKDTIRIPHELDWLSGVAGVEKKWSKKLSIRTGLKIRFAMGNHIGKEDVHSPQIARKIYKTEYSCGTCGNTGRSETNYYTYYGVEMKEWFPFEPYLELRFIKQDRSYIYIGTSFRQFHLQSESGWYKSRRMELLHPRQHDTLARIREVNIFLGIEREDPPSRGSFYIGTTLLDNPKMFSNAGDAKVEYDRISFFAGLGFLVDIF